MELMDDMTEDPCTTYTAYSLSIPFTITLSTHTEFEATNVIDTDKLSLDCNSTL
jgi:hypothetical protein